ncbi:DMT family transporter [Peribacillus huizhouensis]|uniref:Drug/metabolite transporter (DMT)-like permease n=1 Tax=Peribacillus huizhouensis TaxID=1501239 RepID=A0ABR6CNN6_9BACI|nr:DMT family transporter [Peribacillus huizhouensis]MBA9026614.1 drug/metabolite transporter (DMT)-like permease [Peribacillus huizhouensis]
MWVLLAILTSLCFGINNAIFKVSNGRGISKVHIQFFFYLIAFIMTASFGLLNDRFHPNWLSLILGSAIGVLNANGNIQMSRAFEKGPASLTSPLIAANAIFPVIAAALIFGEQLSFLQGIGVCCMLVAAVVIQYAPHAKTDIQYGSWIFHIILAILSFGIIGILMQTTSKLHIQPLDVLTSMYFGGSVYLFVTMFVLKQKIQPLEVKIGSLVGCLSIVGYASYFYALNTGIASIIFPIVSLNCLIVVLAGCYLYKEKLKLYQVAGVMVAFLGIILTKL